MKEITTWTGKTAGATSSGNQAIHTGGGILMMRERGSERCAGLMVLCIAEHGIKGFNMVSGSCSSPVEIEDAVCLCRTCSKKRRES